MYKEVKQTNKQTNKQKASLVHGEAVERIEKKGGVEEKEGEREGGVRVWKGGRGGKRKRAGKRKTIGPEHGRLKGLLVL